MTSDVFSELGPTELDALQKISTPFLYPGGSVIFSEGDPGDAAYVIETGEVAISIATCGRPEQIARLGRGDFFGETALFQSGARSATARTVSAAILWSIRRDEFLRLEQCHPECAARLSAVLRRRQAERFLREQPVAATGMGTRDLHVGDEPARREAVFGRERDRDTDRVLPRARSAGSVSAHGKLESLVVSWASELHARGVTPDVLHPLINDVLADGPSTPAGDDRMGQLLAEAMASASVSPRLEDQLKVLLLYHGPEEARRLVAERTAILS